MKASKYRERKLSEKDTPLRGADLQMGSRRVFNSVRDRVAEGLAAATSDNLVSFFERLAGDQLVACNRLSATPPWRQVRGAIVCRLASQNTRKCGTCVEWLG